MQILGASCDPVEANAAFAARFGFPFPLLSDADRQTCLAYGACGIVRISHQTRINE